MAELEAARGKTAWRLDLAPMAALLTALGNPQNHVPTVLVAGTNGKGSTAVLLSSMASAAGYRTGLYTSPELESVRETVRLDGRALADEDLAGTLDRVVEAARAAGLDRPSPFETLTAAAWSIFRDAAVDLAVVEVGLGGRDDATNLCQPILCLLTPIDLDHEAFLGRTQSEIARVKAGILRPGVSALAWQPHPGVRRALQELAGAAGAELTDARAQVLSLKTIPTPADPVHRQRVDLTVAGDLGDDEPAVESKTAYSLDLALAGAHQADNAALALLAARTLRRLGFPRLDDDAISRGGGAGRWPGRMEIVELDRSIEELRLATSASPGLRRLLLDAAHHPAGAQALAAALLAGGEPFDLLFGVLRDKDAAGILAPLAEVQARLLASTGAEPTRLLLTRPSGARGRDPENLLSALDSAGPWKRAFREPRVIGDPAESLDALSRPAPGTDLEDPRDTEALSKPIPRLGVVAGSLRLVGDVRTALQARFGVPAPAAEVHLYGA